jgi:hypothetical protein
MAGRAGSLLLCLAALGIGCGGPPRVDTSSEKSTVASLRRVRESLPEEMRPAFDQAVTTVALYRLGDNPPRHMGGRPEALGARLLRPLNGMTAHEVLTEARRIAAEAKAARAPGEGATAAPP